MAYSRSNTGISGNYNTPYNHDTAKSDILKNIPKKYIDNGCVQVKEAMSNIGKYFTVIINLSIFKNPIIMKLIVTIKTIPNSEIIYNIRINDTYIDKFDNIENIFDNIENIFDNIEKQYFTDNCKFKHLNLQYKHNVNDINHISDNINKIWVMIKQVTEYILSQDTITKSNTTRVTQSSNKMSPESNVPYVSNTPISVDHSEAIPIPIVNAPERTETQLKFVSKRVPVRVVQDVINSTPTSTPTPTAPPTATATAATAVGQYNIVPSVTTTSIASIVPSVTTTSIASVVPSVTTTSIASVVPIGVTSVTTPITLESVTVTYNAPVEVPENITSIKSDIGKNNGVMNESVPEELNILTEEDKEKYANIDENATIYYITCANTHLRAIEQSTQAEKSLGLCIKSNNIRLESILQKKASIELLQRGLQLQQEALKLENESLKIEEDASQLSNITLKSQKQDLCDNLIIQHQNFNENHKHFIDIINGLTVSEQTQQSDNNTITEPSPIQSITLVNVDVDVKSVDTDVTVPSVTIPVIMEKVDTHSVLTVTDIKNISSTPKLIINNEISPPRELWSNTV